MKKVLFILLMMLTLTSNSQNVITTQPEVVESTTAESFEEMIVKYGSELIESVKSGTEIVLSEASTVVRQFVIYNSIMHGLLLIFGLLLLIPIRKKVFNMFTISVIEYSTYNESIDNDDTNQLYKADKYISILNSYFKSYRQALLAFISAFTLSVAGLYYISLNLLIFIKVTFFSKLYLTELILNMLQ